jgi:hypothetical protein
LTAQGLAPPRDTMGSGASAKNRPAAAPRDASSGVGDPLDLSEFIAAVQVRGPRCTIAKVVAALPPERVQRLEAAMALDTETMPNTAISTVLTNWLTANPVGALTRIGSETVGRHRNRHCACQKD